jgi:hypothetical protein
MLLKICDLEGEKFKERVVGEEDGEHLLLEMRILFDKFINLFESLVHNEQPEF